MTADETIDDDAIRGQFVTQPVDGHVTKITCRCGEATYAENPCIRGMRDHVASGKCRLPT